MMLRNMKESCIVPKNTLWSVIALFVKNNLITI